MRLVSPIKYRSYVLLRFIISSKAVSVNIAVVLGMMLLHLVIVQLFWEDVVARGDIALALPGSKKIPIKIPDSGHFQLSDLAVMSRVSGSVCHNRFPNPTTL